MRLLIDTSVLVDGQRGHLDLFRWLKGIEAAAVPSVVLAEYLVGVHAVHDGRKSAEGRKYFDEVVAHLPVEDFGAEAAATFGEVFGGLRKKGISLDPYDAMIAAMALSLGAGVATSNVRHFAQVPGLTVVSPNPGRTPDPLPEPSPSVE